MSAAASTTMSASSSALALPACGADGATRKALAAFYQAYVSRKPELLDAILDDKVEWLIAGPAEQFDLYGLRSGKAEVIELITRIIPCYFHITDFEIEHLLVQGDRVASYGRVRARQRDTGRALRFGYAHFLCFRGGKLVSLRGVPDTFDAAEQVVGHPIDVTKEIESAPISPVDDFSVV